MDIHANKELNSFSFVLTDEEMQQTVLPQWNELINSNAVNGFYFNQNNNQTGFEITFFADGRELLANVMERSNQETALRLFLQFAQLVFTDNIEQNFLAMYVAAFYDGEKFSFLKPPVFLPQQKTGVLKGFVFGMSNSVAGFDAGLKERLLQACDGAQGVEAFEAVIGMAHDALAAPVPNELSAARKVCPSCARGFPMTSNFCPHCGVQLVVKEIAVPMFEEPVQETPVFEAPVVEESVQEAPAFEAPAEEPMQEAPVFEAPVAEESVQDAPAFEAPAEEPIQAAPAFEAPVVEESIQAEPVFVVPAERIIAETAQTVSEASAPVKACPSCAREFPPTSNFCPHCGVQLVLKETAAPVPPAPAFEEPAQEAPVFEAPVVEEPVQEAPAFEAPAEEPTQATPVFEVPMFEEPVQETPVFEAPVVEEPVQEAPAFEAPAEEPTQAAPVFEAPMFEEPVQETPVFEAPVVEEAVQEAPVFEVPMFEKPVQETPVFEAPVVEEAVQESPVFEAPAEEPVVQEAPVFETPAEEPVQEAPAFEAPIVPPAQSIPVTPPYEEPDYDDYEETTVLSPAAPSVAHLVRKANNENIYITKTSFTLGKIRDRVDYAVSNNKAVSRYHAEITTIGSDYFIIDKNSTNHTYVNGKMIPAGTSVQIFDGDEILLANEVFEFHLQ